MFRPRNAPRGARSSAGVRRLAEHSAGCLNAKLDRPTYRLLGQRYCSEIASAATDGSLRRVGLSQPPKGPGDLLISEPGWERNLANSDPSDTSICCKLEAREPKADIANSSAAVRHIQREGIEDAGTYDSEAQTGVRPIKQALPYMWRFGDFQGLSDRSHLAG